MSKKIIATLENKTSEVAVLSFPYFAQEIAERVALHPGFKLVLSVEKIKENEVDFTSFLPLSPIFKKA